MSYFVERLKRPYDYRVLIEAYIYTQRKNFIHEDFSNYYAGLLEALQPRFGIRFSRDDLDHKQRVFWFLFQSTIRSLLEITNPWAGFLEAGLIHLRLEESGEAGHVVHGASNRILEANTTSEAAHREIIYTLFHLIFGECPQIVTSEELLEAGFDDSIEPDISDYYDMM